MTIKDRLNADLKQAMRERDTARRDTARLLLTTIKNSEIEKGGELDEPETLALLQKQAKQRRDSISAYEAGDRPDLVESEQVELDIIESYLPQQMSEDEIREVVDAQITKTDASGMKDLGRVMGPLMNELRGKADGATVQRLVRERLS